jgi:hypothetical protein
MTRITRMHTDKIDPFFVFNQKGENTILHAELMPFMFPPYDIFINL